MEKINITDDHISLLKMVKWEWETKSQYGSYIVCLTNQDHLTPYNHFKDHLKEMIPILRVIKSFVILEDFKTMGLDEIQLKMFNQLYFYNNINEFGVYPGNPYGYKNVVDDLAQICDIKENSRGGYDKDDLDTILRYHKTLDVIINTVIKEYKLYSGVYNKDYSKKYPYQWERCKFDKRRKIAKLIKNKTNES